MADKKPKNNKGKNKKEEKEVVKTKYSGVLLRPRVTEKSSFLQAGNVYTFEISPKANKPEVAKAIKEAHKVTPARINIVVNPSKKVFVRGKWSKKPGVRKAYVFLKEGDKIEQ